MRLNVGCGSDTWGEVRLDVTRTPRSFYAPKGSSANLIADAQHLPFRNKSFTELRAFEVLEHTTDPRLALSEFRRVSEKITLTVPVDSYTPRHDWIIIFYLSLAYLKYLIKLPQRTREHLWQFNINFLKTYLRKLGFQKIEVEIISYPIFGVLSYGKKGKYFPFRLIKEHFKMSHSWKITASGA